MSWTLLESRGLRNYHIVYKIICRDFEIFIVKHFKQLFNVKLNHLKLSVARGGSQVLAKFTRFITLWASWTEFDRNLEWDLWQENLDSWKQLKEIKIFIIKTWKFSFEIIKNFVKVLPVGVKFENILFIQIIHPRSKTQPKALKHHCKFNFFFQEILKFEFNWK